MGLANNTPPTITPTFVSGPTENLIISPEPHQPSETTKSNPSPPSPEANNGPPQAGLPDNSNAEATPHHYTPRTDLKVYSRGSWCRKQKVHYRDIVKPMTYDTNFHQQPKAFLLNIHEASPPQKFKRLYQLTTWNPLISLWRLKTIGTW